MGTPITWRNIDAPNPALAAQPLQAAGNSVNNAFDIFSKLISQRQALDASNVAALDEGAKQAYLDRVAQAKTPEEVAALQASGQLDSMRQGLSAAARAAVRGADEARLTSVRTNATAANTFDDMVRVRAETPHVEKAKALILAGDASARSVIDAAPIRDKSALYELLHTTGRRTLTEGDADYARPFTRAGLVRADTTGQMNLTEAQRATAEAGRQRGLDDTLTKFVRNHQETSLAIRHGIESGASSFPGAASLPRNRDGMIAVEQMVGTPQYDTLNAHLNKLGLPTLDSVSGDTNAVTNARAALLKAGAKPGDLARLEPFIATSLSTTSPTPVGREAEAVARTMRGLQAEEGMASDQYGSATSQGEKANILSAGMEVVSGITNPGSWARERYTRSLSKWIDEGGIPIKDNKGQVTERVLPSPAQLKLLLSKVDTGVLWTAEGDISKVLDKWAATTSVQEGAQKFIKIRDRNRLMGIDSLGKK